MGDRCPGHTDTFWCATCWTAHGFNTTLPGEVPTMHDIGKMHEADLEKKTIAKVVAKLTARANALNDDATDARAEGDTPRRHRLQQKAGTLRDVAQWLERGDWKGEG